MSDHSLVNVLDLLVFLRVLKFDLFQPRLNSWCLLNERFIQLLQCLKSLDLVGDLLLEFLDLGVNIGWLLII